MRFSNIVLTAIAAAASVEAAGDEFYTVFYNDVTENPQEYLSYIQQNSAGGFTDLLSLYTQLATYTDDSYTSIFTEEDFPASELSSFVVNLPWYSERLEPEIAAAATEGTAESSPSETGSESASASESSVSSASSQSSSSESSASESAASETASDSGMSLDQPKSTLLMGLTAAVISITFGVFTL